MSQPDSPTTSPPSDEVLALAARDGCRDSFEELARRIQVPLLHFLQQWSSREEAEDLTQETFMRAYGNLHRYRSEWKFRTWIFTIARRLSLNAMRRRRPTGNAEELSSIAEPTHPADAVAEADSRRHLWETAGQVLSEREMSALWLYYTEDMPVREIAQVVGRSTSAVKTMLFRARIKLADALEASSADQGAKKSNGRTTKLNKAEVDRE